MSRHGDLEKPLELSLHYARAKKVGKMTEQSTAIVVQRDVSGPLEFTPVQQQMIRDTYANGADPKEFQVLMEIAKVRRLNPLLRQVHFVKRWDRQKEKEVWSVQVSVDGLRAIAERTGKYDGQDEPEYELGKDGRILSCKVKVYRKDWSRPAVGVAYWSEYVQTKRDGTPTKFWSDMPHVMIAKCAEAIAMRKAFPEDMGGLYVDEEMQQAENDRPAQISGHVAPGQDEAAPEDTDVAADLMGKLQRIKDTIAAGVDSYDKALALRALIGTKAKQSELTKRIQEASESGAINGATHRELGKLWQHADRQINKLLEQLKPDVADSFRDEPERQPGEDDGTL